MLFRSHRSRERSPKLVKRAKSLALKKYGKAVCAVGDFDSAARYGKLGAGYIEAHHTTPHQSRRSHPAQRRRWLISRYSARTATVWLIGDVPGYLSVNLRCCFHSGYVTETYRSARQGMKAYWAKRKKTAGKKAG